MQVLDFTNFDKAFAYGHIGNIDNFMNKSVIPYLEAKETKPKKLPKKMPKWISSSLSNSIIIVDGTNCITSNDSEFLFEKLTKYNDVLQKTNTIVLFMRGAGDDPNFFFNKAIDFSNIKAIDDYSVVRLNKYNCLCIGGQVSVDRQWKLKQEKRLGYKMVWNEEKFVYNEDKLNEIYNEFDIKFLITCAIPTFAYPTFNALKENKWLENDEEVYKMVINERIEVDKIYNFLIAHDNRPYTWIVPNANKNITTTTNDIIFSYVGYKDDKIDLTYLYCQKYGYDSSQELQNTLIDYNSEIMEYLEKSDSVQTSVWNDLGVITTTTFNPRDFFGHIPDGAVNLGANMAINTADVANAFNYENRF